MSSTRKPLSPQCAARVPAKLPKRMRIPRACDECRRKKIKCNGTQPCSSCAEFNSGEPLSPGPVEGLPPTASSPALPLALSSAMLITEPRTECTYQNLSRRSNVSLVSRLRQPVPASAPATDVEARLRAAESIIRRFLPQIDLQSLQPIAPATTSPDAAAASSPGGRPHSASTSTPSQALGPEPSGGKEKYIAVVEDEDHVRYTDNGEFDFHGTSSGAAFLSRITQQLPELPHYDPKMPLLPQATRPDRRAPRGTVSLSVPSGPGQHSNYDYSKLPRRELARMLCELCFNHASCLLRIVHVPSFYTRFDALYDTHATEFDQRDAGFVGLLYSILALGSMYDVDENDPSNPDHYDEATSRGYKFYLGALWYLQDLTECRDMTSLQALLFIIQFLQAIGNLNRCYNLIGVALRSALRMGLHRNLPSLRMTPIEGETRKRVFHTIRQMDIYLSSTLGLPVILDARDIDQPLPTAVDDDYITEHAIRAPSASAPSITEAFNAHVKLMDILAAAIEHVYPSRVASRTTAHATYLIDCGELGNVERRLQDWYFQLPEILRPGQSEDVQLTRVQILLRFAYAHVQMVLYRPFLQFFNPQSPSGGPEDKRREAFTEAGINVCRNIISIGLEIRKQAVLMDKPESAELLADAVLGRSSISGLAQKSFAADKLSAALDAVFEHLPSRLSSRLQAADQSVQATPGGCSGVQSPISLTRPTLPTSREQRPLPSAGGPTPGIASQQAAGGSSSGTPSYSNTESPTNPIPTDRVMFPLDDPIAYPSTTAWTPSSGQLSSDDPMQLVVPDFLGEFGGQAGHLSGPSHVDEHSSSIPVPALFPLNGGGGGFLDDAVVDIFGDLDTGRFSDARNPRSRPSWND